ncbi:hypothetical protein HYS47_01345 [Candidatus Woesearchaeota archaeon]|nr:hypothetical protein [Candidatus Woesearchaeota archaeon]
MNPQDILTPQAILRVYEGSESYDRAREPASLYFSDVSGDVRKIAERTEQLLLGHHHWCDMAKDVTVGSQYAAIHALFQNNQSGRAMRAIADLVKNDNTLGFYDSAMRVEFKLSFPRVCRQARELVSPSKLDEILLGRHATRIEGGDQATWWDRDSVVVALKNGTGYACAGASLARGLYIDEQHADGPRTTRNSTVLGYFSFEATSWEGVKEGAQVYAAEDKQTLIEATHNGLRGYLSARFIIKHVGRLIHQQQRGSQQGAPPAVDPEDLN